MKIKGLDLRARDSTGNEVETFKVGFIGNLGFGIRNDNSTDKEFLELFVGVTQSPSPAAGPHNRLDLINVTM